MARVKRFKYYQGMDAFYDVTETTTHKTMLDDGSFIRTDMEGLYIKLNPEGKITSSWKGSKDFVWLFPTKETADVADLEWEEEFFEREYEMEKDVS